MFDVQIVASEITTKPSYHETFEKRPILPAQLNPYLIFNRGSRPRKTKILTTPVRSAGPTGQAGIHWVFWGLKFESDAGIGQKGAFCKGLATIGLIDHRVMATPKHKA